MKQYLNRHYIGIVVGIISSLKELHHTIWCFITKSDISDLQAWLLEIQSLLQATKNFEYMARTISQLWRIDT